MADPSSRNNSLRIPRLRGSGTTSRNPSIRRTSAFAEETRLPSGPFHSLRSSDSRYSLNEQFAATRQEYEFGDDDASSIYERMTVASDVGEPNGDKPLAFDDFVIPEEEFDGAEDDDPSDAPRLDHYELLCLPRDAGLTQEHIRQAYYRLLLLLYPDSYPDYLQPIARRHFHRVQGAFETLIDPHRRAAYDEALASEEDGLELSEAYEDTYKQALSARASNAPPPELDVRLDGARAATLGIEAPAWTTKPALGFTLGHTVQVGIPAIEKFLQRSIGKASGAIAGQVGEAEEASSRLELGTPTLSVTGALQGLFVGSFPDPIVLPGSRTSTVGEAVGEGHHSRAARDVQWQHPHSGATPIATPGGILNVRLTQPILLPGASEPTVLDVAVESPALGGRCPLPRVSLGVQHKLSHGTAFIRGDSGQWLSSDRTRISPGGPAGMGRGLLSGVLPFTSAPVVEVGFTTEASPAANPPAQTNDLHSLTGKTPSLSGGAWTVSATTTGVATAGYLRYTRDLAPRHAQRPAQKRTSRLEAELCTGTWQGSYLALRNLLPVGRLSAAGLELGVSQHSLHLSVHWSRLNQRISLPVLLCPQVLSSPSLIFWAGVLPMAGLAAVDLLRQCWRGSRSRRPATPAQPASQASVVRSRAEADRLVTLLSGPVDAHQKRLAASGDLVILNAKFGIRDDDGSWAAEEVADVTVALAALVGRDGRLVIPRGVRKGHLLGFWDPAPDREKVLFVRFTWRGKEAVAEIRGEDELCLPPVAEADASR